MELIYFNSISKKEIIYVRGCDHVHAVRYGTILTWGLFNVKWCVHEGDHVNAIPYYFSLG